MRIAVHDYAGHPFAFELTRALAARGHEARHFYFAGDYGPKGSAERRADDPVGYSVEPLDVSRPYDKKKLFRRWWLDREYGRKAAAAIKAFRPDIVISGNAPLDAQAKLLDASHAVGAAFIFWMQDMISPLADKQLAHRWAGAGALVARHYIRLERQLVERSDGVILISGDFVQELERLGIRAASHTVIPNWGTLNEIDVRPTDNAWSERMGITGKTVLLYSGTLGVKHSPLMLVDLADALADRPDVLILVAAVGTGRALVEEQLAARPRPNMRLEPLQPIADFPDMLGSATLLVALLEEDAGRFCVPSKVLSYLCAGRPILLSAPDENLATSMLKEADAGWAVPPGDSDSFVAAAKAALADHDAKARAGRNGRAYAERTFEMEAVAERFERVFAAALEKRRA